MKEPYSLTSLYMNPVASELAAIIAPMYLIMGVSIILYARPWQELMTKWKKDHLAMFPIMFFYPILGMIIIRMHNVWEWTPSIIITLIGWGLLIKGAGYFIIPGGALKKLLDIKSSKVMLYLGGVLALALAGILGYYGYLIEAVGEGL